MNARFKASASGFERLSAREQLTVLGLALVIICLMIGFGGYMINHDLALRQKRMSAKIDKLKIVAQLRGDYQRRLADQQRLASEVKHNQNMRILSYLEELATRAQVDLGNASERAGSPTGSDQVREEAAEVAITNVSLDKLYRFLEEIENGNPLVKVRQLKIKNRFDKKDMLDASITVGTFKPAT